ncbi:MAG: hypothetical protein Q8M20_17950 [Rhodocyclaceae bacterium]|nr:hypothetical protein [Rhodocyclaceae bacterium]
MTELLEAFKAKRAEIGTKELADALGIKDSAVRMVCTGNYPNPHNILNQFARHFINVVDCPYAGRTLERSDCHTRSTAPRPFGGAAKLNWWQACQHCEHRS